MINKETVRKLAELTRIEISDEEQESLVTDLESILGYVSELSGVNGLSLEEVLGQNINSFREDSNVEPALLYTDKILEEVPRTREGYIIVKQVIGEKGAK